MHTHTHVYIIGHLDIFYLRNQKINDGGKQTLKCREGRGVKQKHERHCFFFFLFFCFETKKKKNKKIEISDKKSIIGTELESAVQQSLKERLSQAEVGEWVVIEEEVRW